MTACPKCHGDGEITVYPSGHDCDPRANFTTCPQCHGAGMLTDRQLHYYLTSLPVHARAEAEAWLTRERNRAA